MRLVRNSRLLHHFGIECELLQKRQLLGQIQHVNGRIMVGTWEAGLFRFPKDAGQTGVGILDIVHRVLECLGLGDLQIKVERAVRAARKEEETGRILPDLLNDLGQCYELPTAL